MKLKLLGCVLIGAMALAQPPARRPAFDAFEVATVKPTPPDDYRGARLFKMQSAHQFIAKNYPLRILIGVAYNLTPRAISGGPEWIDSDRFDIVPRHLARSGRPSTSRCRCCRSSWPTGLT
jgi:hypothetical protein